MVENEEEKRNLYFKAAVVRRGREFSRTLRKNRDSALIISRGICFRVLSNDPSYDHVRSLEGMPLELAYADYYERESGKRYDALTLTILDGSSEVVRVGKNSSLHH